MTTGDLRKQIAFFRAEVRMESLSHGDKTIVQSNLMILEALADLRETAVMGVEALLDIRDSLAEASKG